MIKEASLIAGTALMTALFFAPSTAQTEEAVETAPIAAEPVNDKRSRLEKEQEAYDIWAASSKVTGGDEVEQDDGDESGEEETGYYEPSEETNVAAVTPTKKIAEVSRIPAGTPFHGEIPILD